MMLACRLIDDKKSFRTPWCSAKVNVLLLSSSRLELAAVLGTCVCAQEKILHLRASSLTVGELDNAFE